MKRCFLILALFSNLFLLAAQECTLVLQFDGAKMELTEAQWKNRLSPDQYALMREKKKSVTGSVKQENRGKEGNYICAACALTLFSSKDRLKKGGNSCLSFSKPICPANVELQPEKEPNEVFCARCDSYLGSYDQNRIFCINPIALKLLPL